MWVIEVTNKTGNVRFSHTVFEGSTRIGRAADNEIALAGREVSRHHGRLDVENGRLVYRDLGSRNGSYAQGQRIDAPTTLNIGTVIEVGDYWLTVKPDPSLSDPGRFLDADTGEPVTAPPHQDLKPGHWSSATEMLGAVRQHVRQTAQLRNREQRSRHEHMEREWARFQSAVDELGKQLSGDPRVLVFLWNENRTEVSIKLRDPRRNGGSRYLIASRGYPELPAMDADDAVWIREIGGNDQRYTEPRDALEALVRQIALLTAG